MNKVSAAIILSGMNINSSLAKLKQTDIIYATTSHIDYIKSKILNSKTSVHAIHFEELTHQQCIDYINLFFVLSSFGEMNTELFADDTQVEIIDAVKMISMPHVRRVSIHLTKLHILNTSAYITKIAALANGVGAQITLDDSQGVHLRGIMDIRDNSLSTINITK